MHNLIHWKDFTHNDKIANHKKSLLAIQDSRDWLALVLAPTYLPPSDSKPSLTRKEIDVITEQWESDKYIIESMQTKHVCSIIFTLPDKLELKNKSAAETAIECFKKIQLLLPENLEIYTLQIKKVKVPFFREFIESTIFVEPLKCEKQGDIVFMKGAQTDIPEFLSQKAPTAINNPLFLELQSIGFKNIPHNEPSVWYRNINCWTDGKHIGLFFMKNRENDPNAGMYKLEEESNWFREEKK